MSAALAVADAIRLQASRLEQLAAHLTCPPVSEIEPSRLVIIAAPTLASLGALERELMALLGMARGLSKLGRGDQ